MSRNIDTVRRVPRWFQHVRSRADPGLPEVTQVGGKSFIYFRTPRPDAVDASSGERYDDVIVFWVASEADKQAMVQDPAGAQD